MTKPEALAAWRKRHGLTQEDAARLAESSLSGWRQWETGATTGPSTDTLVRLEACKPGLLEMLKVRSVSK